MENKIFEQVQKAIAEKLSKKEAEIHMESRFKEDLEADSLDNVELIMEFEERFKIDIPDADAERIKTVGQVVEYIQNAEGKSQESGVTSDEADEGAS